MLDALGCMLFGSTLPWTRIVAETVIDRFDHKNLNVQVAEFADVIQLWDAINESVILPVFTAEDNAETVAEEMLLVRKGGFAIARVEHARVVESKVGQRHVQGRTKAGGQSQQRFARRRANQARDAYEAAAGHAARILEGVDLVVAGGDRGAVTEVLTDARLSDVRVVGGWHAVPDPRRAVLDVARLLVDRGFSLVATGGTARYLREQGLECEMINKVIEGRPHIVDLIKNGEIVYIVNTTEGKTAIADSFSIRREALQHRLTYSTTIPGARALIQAIDSRNHPRVWSLQELHRELNQEPRG